VNVAENKMDSEIAGQCHHHSNSDGLDVENLVQRFG
jgi:hypothetical protein